MKLKSLLFVLCLALLAGCQKDPDTESTPARDTDRVEGVIRMKLDRETAEALNVTRTRSGRVLTGNISFDELCERYDVTGMERLFADNGCAERTRKAGLDLWYIIRFEGSAEQVAEDFGEIAGVNHVEIPRRITKVGGMSRKSGTPWRKLLALPKAAPSNYPFNDPLFAEQWPLYNDGSVYPEAVAGADINIIPAWTKTAGRSDVIVAVVDEGVEYTHPDLAGNMWSGIGKNFCDRDNDDITWGEGHGTHVAGTIAAVSNNGIGISGIAGGTGGGNGAKIMSCEIFHPTDGRYDANSNATADAIKYAADNGAVICQNSWGYEAGTMSLNQWINQDLAVKEAIDYFIRYAGMSPDGETQTGPMAGGIVLFAAGNEYSRLASYPAAYEPCISVAAISCAYEAAWYTNYGSTIDICAPGGGEAANFVNNIGYDEGYNLSTLPTNLKNGDRFTYTDYFGNKKTTTIDYVSTTVGYGYMHGTSMACPHVSGVAALIVSQFGAPGFTNEQLKEKLFSTARDIDSYQGQVYDGSGTYAGKIGKLVDAGAALDSGEVPPVSDQPTITPAAGQSDTFSLAEDAVKTLTYTLAHYTDWSLNDPTGKITKSIVGDVVTLTIDASQYTPGTYTAVLQAVNGSKTANRTITYTIESAVPKPDAEPTITPAPGQSDTFSLAENAVKTLTYTLADYTDWSLNDPTGKITKSIAGNVVTLTIDASKYVAGSYTAELLAVNGTKTAKRTISYSVTRNNDPTPPTPDPDPTDVSMDFYPNPCTDVLNVLANRSGEGAIRIRNSVGAEVMNRKLVFANGKPAQLDVSGLAPGVYMLDMTYKDITITRTIVKR
ncbi:S8 family serine peptidase [Alistipes putredinis]|uniref:S8 family serine peptidase n=1 Tax=Alistipes putredinis TaxID=28117 RepID=UPI0024B0B5A3|nr:S8 family serine peptidase [Alistipes putredinis]